MSSDGRAWRRRAPLLLGAALAAGALALVIRQRSQPIETMEPATSEAAPLASESAEPIPVSERAEPVVEPAPAEPTATATTPSAPPPQPRARIPVSSPRSTQSAPTQQPSAAKKPNCNPAFEFDAEGNKRYKPGCLDR